MRIIILLIAFTFSTQLYADQCSILPKKKAIKAKNLIKQYIKSHQIAVVDIYCKACRDEVPKPIVAETISLEAHQIKGYQQILLNQRPVDLAYLFVDGVNMASLIDCKTKGVNKYL